MCRKSSKDSQVSKDNSNVSLGLDFDQRWQIIQHFTEWIKHGDSKIQMLLTVEGVIIAGFGAFLPTLLTSDKGVSEEFKICSIIFIFWVICTILYGFFRALQPYNRVGKNNSNDVNIFFYGSYAEENLPRNLYSADHVAINQDLNSQIAVLGKIANDKFKRVKRLQWLVVISCVSFFAVVVSVIWR